MAGESMVGVLRNTQKKLHVTLPNPLTRRRIDRVTHLHTSTYVLRWRAPKNVAVGLFLGEGISAFGRWGKGATQPCLMCHTTQLTPPQGLKSFPP